MIRWSLVTMVVLLLAPHAFAQDSASESNNIIYMDPSSSDDAAEELEAQPTLSPMGVDTVSAGAPRLEESSFLVRGTLYSAGLAALAGIGGSLATVLMWTACDECAVAGLLGTAALVVTGAVVGAGQPARTTGGRCAVSSRVLGLVAGGLASTLVVSTGVAVAQTLSVRGSEEALFVPVSVAAFTLPHLGAAYFCYNAYTPDAL